MYKKKMHMNRKQQLPAQQRTQQQSDIDAANFRVAENDAVMDKEIIDRYEAEGGTRKMALSMQREGEEIKFSAINMRMDAYMRKDIRLAQMEASRLKQEQEANDTSDVVQKFNVQYARTKALRLYEQAEAARHAVGQLLLLKQQASKQQDEKREAISHGSPPARRLIRDAEPVASAQEMKDFHNMVLEVENADVDAKRRKQRKDRKINDFTERDKQVNEYTQHGEFFPPPKNVIPAMRPSGRGLALQRGILAAAKAEKAEKAEKAQIERAVGVALESGEKDGLYKIIEGLNVGKKGATGLLKEGKSGIGALHERLTARERKQQSIQSEFAAAKQRSSDGLAANLNGTDIQQELRDNYLMMNR
jgi:hypothetical protein